MKAVSISAPEKNSHPSMSVNPNSPDRAFPLQRTRNIGIAAHIDAGKTTLTERILFYTGMIHRLGEVHDGAATTDHMEQERERGITIQSAAVTCSWEQKAEDGVIKLFQGDEQRVNIIDTPGHVDFTAEVERSLRVLDGAIVVFCGVAGVQPQTETVWRQANKYSVPRIIFVNKMDRVGADFQAVVEEVREKLGANALPILIPLGSEDSLRGQLDVVNQKAVIYTEDDLLGSTYTVRDLEGDEVELGKLAYTELLEGVASGNDELGEKFLMEEEITLSELKTALREATIKNEIVPVAGGSAFKNKGVQYLLDAVADYLPSPLDIEAAVGMHPDDENKEVLVETDDAAKFCALAFKLTNDKHFGKFVFFRVYSGSVSKGDQILNPRTGKKERVGRLIQIQADSFKDIDTCYSGDIAGMVGLKDTATGDTLSNLSFKVALERPIFPEPVIGLAVEPRSTADSEKMAVALSRLSDEDPTFVVSINEETGQTIISGMGELHLEVIVDRLLREFKVQARVGKPQISYRESISQPATGEGILDRQTGETKQFGHVVLEVKSNEKGSGNTFENTVKNGVIPKEFFPGIERGLKEAMTTGIVAGYPVVDVHVNVKDGSFHEVDSNENTFRMAAIFAIRDAFAKANSILLEPVMDVEVSTPPDYQGDVMGDLNRRRAQLGSMETKGTICTLKAQAPLSAMFGYMTDLRTLSSGRASFTMEPSSFEQVPDKLVDELTGRRPAA